MHITHVHLCKMRNRHGEMLVFGHKQDKAGTSTLNWFLRKKLVSVSFLKAFLGQVWSCLFIALANDKSLHFSVLFRQGLAVTFEL